MKLKRRNIAKIKKKRCIYCSLFSSPLRLWFPSKLFVPAMSSHVKLSENRVGKMPKPITNPEPFPPNRPWRRMFGLACASCLVPWGRPGMFSWVAFFFLSWICVNVIYRDLPWVFIVLFSVDRNDTICWYTTLADGTHHGFSWLVHPSVNARPAIQVSAFTHDRLFGSL